MERMMTTHSLLATGLRFTVATSLAVAFSVSAADVPELQDLSGPEELAAIFNAGEGRPRMILLLSPT